MQYFIELNEYVKDMSPSELRYHFPADVSDAFLMRSLIMNEKEYGENYPRTLRGVWYSVVKPTLDKLGKLTEDDQTEEGLKKWDSTLSKYMGDLLRRGYIMYKDLGIEDQSRRKELPQKHYSAYEEFKYQITGEIYPNIIIATEKDTVFNILYETATLFGCSCLSSKGQNSLGAMEYLISKMDLTSSPPDDWSECNHYTNKVQFDFYNEYHDKRKNMDKIIKALDDDGLLEKKDIALIKESTNREEIKILIHEIDLGDSNETFIDYIYDTNNLTYIYNQIEWKLEGKHLKVRKKTNYRFDTIYILTMTDYDPSGYYIATALKKQADDILKALGYTGINVVIDRIGIEPHQLSDYDVTQNMYTPKKTNLDKWFEITNGINGKKMGLELDAFHPNKIKEIFVEKLLEYVDLSKYHDFIKDAYIKKMVLKTLRNKINLISEEILAEFSDYINVNEDYSIIDASNDGYSYLPLDNMINQSDIEKITLEVKKVAKKHFRKFE